MSHRSYQGISNYSDVEVASERIALDAPIAGHSAVEIDLSTRVLGRELACFTVSNDAKNDKILLFS